LVILTSGDISGEPETLGEVDEGIADLVVLKRAWPDRPGLTEAVRSAHRAVQTGGRMIAADIDLDRLLASSAIRYPMRLQFSLLSEPFAGAGRRSMRMPLSIETARAGFRDVEFFEVDEERETYPDVRSYWEALREQGSPVFADLSPEDTETLLEATAEQLHRVAPIGGITDRRPWFVVAGIKR
jgi:hypothetical protein